MRNRIGSLAVAILAAMTVPACSSTAGGSATQSGNSSGGRYMLTESELQAATERTLYEVIQRQRPTFFRSRQVRSNTTPNPEPVHVFVDGTRVEGVESLKLFTPRNVKEVRFYEPHEANVRFGTGHHGGLISVTLLK
jgi:hypothetical protein